jgi:uncharacterized membrane protein
MNADIFEWVTVGGAILGACLTLYGALRGDLAKAIAKATTAEQLAIAAHGRIDNLILDRRGKT